MGQGKAGLGAAEKKEGTQQTKRRVRILFWEGTTEFRCLSPFAFGIHINLEQSV